MNVTKIIPKSLGVAGCVLILFGMACSRPVDQEKADSKRIPDFQAPIFHPQGQSAFHLSAINQKRPVLLVFWATWCPSCKEEVPQLNQLASTYRGKIEIAAINVEEEPDEVQKFLTENQVDFPVLLDPDGAVSTLFEVTALPSVLLLAKGGEILYYGFRLPDKEKLEAVLTV